MHGFNQRIMMMIPFIDRAIFLFHFHGIFYFILFYRGFSIYYVHFITGAVLFGSPL